MVIEKVTKTRLAARHPLDWTIALKAIQTVTPIGNTT